MLFLFLFTLPILIGQLPFPNNKTASVEEPPEQKLVAYAAAPMIDSTQEVLASPFNVLLLFTHSHESYKPIVKLKSGVQAVNDDQTNVFSLQEVIGHYLQLNGMQSHVLDLDVMSVMKKQGAPYHQAYKVVRPYLQEQLQQADYDLVLDIHRDSAPESVTTLKAADGQTFAKIAFVIGAEHEKFEWNYAYAETLSERLNMIVPGISRGVIKKEGEGVDGIYNQDLSQVMLLVELGGIDNDEEQLERTMAVLAQAIAKTFVNEQL